MNSEFHSHIIPCSIWDHKPARANDYASIVPKILVIPLHNRTAGYPTLRCWSHNFFEPPGKPAAVLERTAIYISDFTAARVSQIWFGWE